MNVKGAGLVICLSLFVASACGPIKVGFGYPNAHCESGDIYNCARYPATPLLAQTSPSGYRFQNADTSATNGNDLFIALVLSGGGTRSASFSYGVMRELGRTIVPRANRTLLDEVDLISSVSGGSFPAAYFALYGPQGFPNFEKDFLNWDAQGDLVKSVLFDDRTRNRLKSKYFSRIDVAVENWDKHLFHGKTFGDITRRRPFLMIDATALSTGTVFPFTQANVDPLCIDLSRFTLARAVGASGAFPPALNPVTIENHAGKCGYHEPQWVVTNLADPADDPELYRYAEEVRSYGNLLSRPWIQLTDGGVGDNIGARNVMRALVLREHEVPLFDMIEAGTIKRLLIVVVNAKTTDENKIDRQPYPPTFLQTAMGAAGAPMTNYSRQSIGALWKAVKDLEAENPKAYCSNGTVTHGCRSMFYTVELSFDQIPDPNERLEFQHLPTSYSLPERTVTALISQGAELLRKSSEYNRLLCDLETGDWRQRGADSTCAAHAKAGVLYTK